MTVSSSPSWCRGYPQYAGIEHERSEGKVADRTYSPLHRGNLRKRLVRGLQQREMLLSYRSGRRVHLLRTGEAAHLQFLAHSQLRRRRRGDDDCQTVWGKHCEKCVLWFHSLTFVANPPTFMGASDTEIKAKIPAGRADTTVQISGEHTRWINGSRQDFLLPVSSNCYIQRVAHPEALADISGDERTPKDIQQPPQPRHASPTDLHHRGLPHQR